MPLKVRGSGYYDTSCSTPQSASAPHRFYPLLSRFEYIDLRTCPLCPGPSPFRPQDCPFACGDLDPHLIYGSLGPPESTTQTTFDRFSRFCGAHDGDRHTDRPTDHATPGITIGHTYIVLRCGVIIPPLNYLDLIASNNTDAIYDSAFAYYWTYPLKLK